MTCNPTRAIPRNSLLGDQTETRRFGLTPKSLACFLCRARSEDARQMVAWFHTPDRQRQGLIIKGKRRSCPPQYGHQDPHWVPRRLRLRQRQRRGSEHGFPLIRSLRASVPRSTSVLLSFVRSFDCGRIIYHPAIKNDSSAIPQPTEWQHVGNQIDAAMVFTRSHFVNMHLALHTTLSLPCGEETRRFTASFDEQCSLGHYTKV